MIKTLLYVDENLSSSIALRYAAYLYKLIDMELYVTHVEEPDPNEQAGTGWVRRTWENGVASSGMQLIERMLRTEKIDCPLAGRPKVFVGEKAREISYELRSGSYNLYMEGYLNTADSEAFYQLISSPVYTKAPCPVMVVKNLSLSTRCALLCDDSVEPQVLVEKTMDIIGDSTLSVDLVFFKFSENSSLTFLKKEEAGSTLLQAEKLLEEAGKAPENVSVLRGTPEQAGDHLKDYVFVSSTLPTRKSMRMEVLANTLSTVMLVR
ncbi:hypothetical protein [Desulfolithobacter sp.]